MSVQPFKVNIPQAKIDRLKAKLAVADFPDELEGAGWDYGSPLADIKRLATYWHEKFDWRKAEAELNEMPQFTTSIQIEGYDPIDLHFVHVKSSVPGAIPLLFAHGWPGTFDEVSKILPELVKGGKDFPAFDVIAPSMPNYGFSSSVLKRGFHSRHIGMVFHKLMTDVLGYDEYVTQGGDIGYAVTRFMGFLYPQHCKASHYNFPQPEEPTADEHPELAAKWKSEGPSKADEDGFARTKWFKEEGFGYNLEQGTKPQTLGYSLLDSPVGLLAWIYEKLHDWTDNYPFTDYEVCKWVSIYYFSTAGPHASVRVYYENKHSGDPDRPRMIGGYIDNVKMGITKFPKELYVMPQRWNPVLGNIVFDKMHESGGHFAAFERPTEIVADLREMFGKNGGAYSSVKGRTGYA